MVKNILSKYLMMTKTFTRGRKEETMVSKILLTIDKIKRAIALLIIKNLNPDGLTKESPI